MQEVIIKLDYLNGPIWKNIFNVKNNKKITGIDKIDNDIIIQALDEKACEIYSSLYKFDTQNSACIFDEKAFESAKPQLSKLIQAISDRLEIINHGEFTVLNEESERLLSA